MSRTTFVLHIMAFPQSAEFQQSFEIVGKHTSKWASQPCDASGTSWSDTPVAPAAFYSLLEEQQDPYQLAQGYQSSPNGKFYLLNNAVYQRSEAESYYHGYQWVFSHWHLVGTDLGFPVHPVHAPHTRKQVMLWDESPGLSNIRHVRDIAMLNTKPTTIIVLPFSWHVTYMIFFNHSNYCS